MKTNHLTHLPAGTLVAGRYEILEAIGQGGFGITYKGYDTILDVPVAIKEYYPADIAHRHNSISLDVSVDGREEQQLFDEGKRKFLEEARTLAKFAEDPNVVGVRDFFEDNRTVYIVMQYLEGESLKEYTEKNGQMSFPETFFLLRPVMQSLGRMHANGLIHRDISPSNMIRMRGGKIKLIDFGTAREISAEGEKSLSVMLKPGYAPVEQYQKRGAQGPWTDVYALCASIYKLITGVTPENSINRILEDDLKRPSELGAEITPAQEEALMRGLAVRAEDRIRDMGALEEAFDEASRSAQPEASKVKNMQIAPPPAHDPGEAEYDDERTVKGPPANAGAGKARKTAPAVSDYAQNQGADPAAQKSAAVSDHIQTKEPGVDIDDTVSVTDQGTDSAANDHAQNKPAATNRRNSSGKSAGRNSEETGRESGSGCTSETESGRKSGRKSEPGAESASDGKSGRKSDSESGRKSESDRKHGRKHGRKSDSARDSAPRKPLLKYLGIALAAILAVAAVAFFLHARFHGTAGGDIYDYSTGSLIVLKGEGEELLTVNKSMLNELDRNKKVTRLEFRRCDLSDDIITRLASMKRIEEITFEKCAGFTTLAPLSDLQTLQDLTLRVYPSDGVVLDGEAVFASDIPQLTKLSLYGYFLKDGPAFLEHFPGLQELEIISVGGTFDAFPDFPELTSCYITETDLGSADLSAFGRAPYLAEVTLNSDQVTSLSFLETASALSSLKAVDNQLTSLEGLGEKENLTFVTVPQNRITDISALGSCPNLYGFDANDNQIANITALQSCPGLKELSLNRNQIADISPLGACGGLRRLHLQKNQISDVSALSNCRELTILDLSDNQISDASAIMACTEMQMLDVSRNAVSDLLYCEQMINLESLQASENQISSLDGMQNVTQLVRVHLDNNQISDISLLAKNGEHLQIAILDKNQISDLTPLSACTGLKALSANENQLTSLAGVGNCVEMAYVSASGNRISDISALEGCTALYTADLGENQITDVTALGVSGSTKMALLLQNNQISDISPLYGMKDYVYLILYNNQITDITGMSAMTDVSTTSELYLDYWDGLDPTVLAETSYREPRVVEMPLDRQVNFQDAYKEKRSERNQYDEVKYLTQQEADLEVAEIRATARVTAGIEEETETDGTETNESETNESEIDGMETGGTEVGGTEVDGTGEEMAGTEVTEETNE